MRGLTAPIVKLVVFAMVTILASYVLLATITNAGYGEQTTYRAQFTDVAGLVAGDEVRIAGVRVGQVTDIGLTDDRESPMAEIGLEVASDVRLPTSVQATIRYRNLVGQRYISLSEEVGDTSVMKPGETIPVDRTKPALDLTLLFNGFKPLFQALSPDDINQFSYELVQVFQGEGGTLESLLRSTASVTSTLADRDQVIGELLKNLDYVLDHLADAHRIHHLRNGAPFGMLWPVVPRDLRESAGGLPDPSC